MPKIFLIKNRLHQQQQRLLESQNLLQHKAQDDERCLVPPLSPSRVDRVSPTSSGSSSTSPVPTRPTPTPTPTPTPPTAPEPQPEPQDQHDQQQQQQQQQEKEQPLSLTTATATTTPTTSAASTSIRKRFHHRRHYFGQTRHSLESNSCADVAVAAASQVQNGK